MRTVTTVLALSLAAQVAGQTSHYQGIADRSPHMPTYGVIDISFDLTAHQIEIAQWDIFYRDGTPLLSLEPVQAVLVPSPNLPLDVFSFSPLVWRDYGGNTWTFTSNVLNSIAWPHRAWIIDSSCEPELDYFYPVSADYRSYPYPLNNLRTSAPEPGASILAGLLATGLWLALKRSQMRP